MKRAVIGMILASLLALPMGGQASANHPHAKWVKGEHCGSKFNDADECSFRYKGGPRLYLGGSVTAANLPAAAVLIRLEAVNRTTGQREVLASCWTGSTSSGAGGCAGAGVYAPGDGVRKGDKLFCVVQGEGRGNYECGTMVKKRQR